MSPLVTTRDTGKVGRSRSTHKEGTKNKFVVIRTLPYILRKQESFNIDMGGMLVIKTTLKYEGDPIQN